MDHSDSLTSPIPVLVCAAMKYARRYTSPRDICHHDEFEDVGFLIALAMLTHSREKENTILNAAYVLCRAFPVNAARIAHHVATDDANPRDAHDEGEYVVLFELRPRTVRHGKAERHCEGQAEDEQEALRPSVGPRKPILLSAADSLQ